MQFRKIIPVVPELIPVLLFMAISASGLLATDPHDSKGPDFTVEPPHRLEFMNRAGARLDCIASGNPTPSIEWLDQENTPLSPIQKVCGMGIAQVWETPSELLQLFTLNNLPIYYR